MLTKAAVAFFAFAIICGCRSKLTIAYAPPAQDPPEVLHEIQEKYSIEMSDRDIGDYIIRDISSTLEAGTWRWTFDRPELRLGVPGGGKFRLDVAFAVADATFKDTGPVVLSVRINGRLLGTILCEKPGPYKFSKVVPRGWLQPNTLATVAIPSDPLWRTPDGKYLGVILTRVGFLVQ